MLDVERRDVGIGLHRFAGHPPLPQPSQEVTTVFSICVCGETPSPAPTQQNPAYMRLHWLLLVLGRCVRLALSLRPGVSFFGI